MHRVYFFGLVIDCSRNDREMDESVEEFECRICREEGDDTRPLLHPCACSGSIKWCHESCILEWLKASKRENKCETCNKHLTFSSLYQTCAPDVLPLSEIAWLLFKRFLRRIPFLLRLVCVVCTWLVGLPLFSAVVFNNLRLIDGDRKGLPWERIASFTTLEQGFWIVVVLVCAVFLIVTVIDFVRQFESGVFAMEVDQMRQRLVVAAAAAANNNNNVAPAAAAAIPFQDDEPIDDGDDDDEEEEEINNDAPWLNEENNQIPLDEENDGLADWFGIRGSLWRMVNVVMFVCLFVVVLLTFFYTVPEVLGRYALQRYLTTMAAPRTYGSSCLARTPFREQVFCVPEERLDAFLHLRRVCFEMISVIVGTVLEVLLFVLVNLMLRFIWRFVLPRMFHRNDHSSRIMHAWSSAVRISCSVFRVQKIVCLFAFKMVFFPTVLGVWIERALRPVFRVSEDDRLFFASEKPHLALLCLWFAGITHTLLVSVNVILVRDILHPEVLDGIIKMRDPHANQFLPMLVESGLHQTKRTLVTCVIYTAIVLLFLAIPVQLLGKLELLPIPLSVSFFSVSVELPIELGLLHVWMLTVLEKNKARIVRSQEFFFRTACHKLGLTAFVMPIPKDAAAFALAKRLAQVQAAQLHWLDSQPRILPSLLAPRQRPSFAPLRVFGLMVLAWMFWLAVHAVLLVLPFKAGVLVWYCFPVFSLHHHWLYFDARLYFVGWLLLDFLLDSWDYTRIANVVNGARPKKIVYGLTMGLFLWLAPLVSGVFAVLLLGCSDRSFPADKYRALSVFELYGQFTLDIWHVQSMLRLWCAGLPLLACFSLSEPAKRLWRSLLDAQFGTSGRIALDFLALFCLFQVLGVFFALLFWKHAEFVYVSPLLVVRLTFISACAGVFTGFFLVRNANAIKTRCEQVHQSLKDEKYLLGRRLINFQS